MLMLKRTNALSPNPDANNSARFKSYVREWSFNAPKKAANENKPIPIFSNKFDNEINAFIK
jgi:hypothetical protein